MKIPFLLLTLILSIGCSKTPKPDVQEVKESKGPSVQELFISGNKHLEAKEWKKAIAVYKKAENVEKRWDIYLNRGIAEIQAGDFNDALNSFDLALKNGGDKEPVVYFNLGNLYQERGLYQQAVDSYRAGLVYVPAGESSIDMIINLGASYVFLRQWDAANETYTYLQTQAPNNPAALHGLGMVLQMQGKYLKAIEKYDQVTNAFPKFAMSHYTKAQCFAAKKKYKEAITSYQAYKRVFPDSKYLARVDAIIKKYESKLK